MKLVTFNIGIKIDNANEVASFLCENDFDIVALQESMRALDDLAYDIYHSGQIINKKLSKEHKHSFFAPLFVSEKLITNSEVRDFGGFIEQGNHIISKYNILETSSKFYYNDYGHWFDARDFRENDWARCLQKVVVEKDEKKIQIFNIHGIWNKTRMGDERTVAQCEFVIKEALKSDLPTIILGDFNLLPESESIKLITDKFRNLCVENGVKSTRPELDDGLDRGNMVVDYIFVNENIKVNNFSVFETDISDHLPLVLDFEII